MAQGMTPEEARRNALIEFGGVEQARERCQEQEPGWWIDTLVQDVRYALRGFRRSKAFAVSAVLTLALAIGATTAVFSVVDPILFRALPYADAGRLASVGFTVASQPEEFMTGRFTWIGRRTTGRSLRLPARAMRRIRATWWRIIRQSWSA